MTRTEHLLTIVAEECNEIAQRCSKALRFGLAEVQPGQDKTNAQRIMDEVNDFLAAYQMLAGPVISPTTPLFQGSPAEWMEAIRAKQEKVEKFLKYSAECGTLSEATKTPQGECSACGYPNNADGTCSRSQCYNSD